MSNSSMALTEQWAVLEVSDGENMTVRQTNGNQMQVRLCGIDVLNVKQDKASGQALGPTFRTPTVTIGNHGIKFI